MSEELAQSRTLAAVLTRHDCGRGSMVFDIAARRGGFLATMPDRFDRADGIWFGFYETMLGNAKMKLAPVRRARRVPLGDMSEVASAARHGAIDEGATSHAIHHVNPSNSAACMAMCSNCSDRKAGSPTSISLPSRTLEPSDYRCSACPSPQRAGSTDGKPPPLVFSPVARRPSRRIERAALNRSASCGPHSGRG